MYSMPIKIGKFVGMLYIFSGHRAYNACTASTISFT